MKNWIRITTMAALMLMSANAFGQSEPPPPTISPDSECTVDADCMDGEICEIAATDVGCPPCIDGEMCDPCPEPQNFGYCTAPPPPPCTSDADCGGGDVCVTYSYEICSGSSGGGSTVAPCDPDSQNCESMPDPEPEPDTGSCTTESESLCVPPYVAPCQADADCGAGFTCTDIEICECSSEPVMTGDDEPSMSPDSNCTCSPTGDKYCELNEVACTSDADCAASLVCISFGGGDTAVPCRQTEDGETICEEPTPVEPESYCAPVGYDDWGGPAGGPSLDLVAEATGQDESNLASSDRISWGSDSSGGGSKSDAGGCSAAGADASVFGLLLLAGFFLKRRRD